MDLKEFFLCHLSEYYGVSLSEALELGTRKDKRKPTLPGSTPCFPVSGVTMEDIWGSRSRETQEDIFGFYKDQGAWSAFRQCVRLSEAAGAYQHFLNSSFRGLKDDDYVVCEYGCGVASFSFLLLNGIPPSKKIKIYLSDVDCEHFTFGIWRLEKIIKTRGLDNVEIVPKGILPDELPCYEDPLDIVFIHEVLEHVPDPFETTKNLFNHMNEKASFVENFIKHEPAEDEEEGCDLLSAREGRGKYYNFLEKNFELFMGESEKTNPNGTRIWKKATK